MVFFDTNLFVYVVSASLEDRPRRVIAQRLITESDFALSVQVLQEFMDVTLRKKHLGVTPWEVKSMVSFMATYPMAETSAALALRALELKLRFDLRYWDAALIAAALDLGCHTLYSEDFNHGQNYDGVTVINPFLEAMP